MLREPQVAPYDVFQQTYGVVLQLGHHAGQHEADCVEPLRSGTHVGQAGLVEQDLLYDEGGHGLRQLGPRLHYPQTERNDLRLQQEVDYVAIIHLQHSSG